MKARITSKDALRVATRIALGVPIVLGLPVAMSTSALAQESGGQDGSDRDGNDIETVYVYGRSLEATLPQELAGYGSDLVTLGRMTVEEKLYVDPQQMLQMEVPGLYLTSAGPFSYHYVSIQGSRLARYGPSDILWLVDGVRLNNRLYPSTNSDTLPANMVERIEILKGGESLYYGTSAAGGVINIVSRDFSDTFGGDVSVGADSNDSYTVSTMVRGPAGPGNFVFFASQDESDGYEIWSPVEPSATDREQGYDVTNVGLKYGLDIGSDLRLVGQIQHTEGTIDNLSPAATYAAYNERDEEIVSLRLDYVPSEGAQFFLKAYYHDWDSLYTQIENVIGSPGMTSGDVDVPWGYDDSGFNAAGKLRPGGGPEFLLGYDYQKYDAMDDYWMIQPITEKVHAFFGQIRTTEDQMENGAVSFGVRHNDGDAASATVWNLSGKYNLSDTLYLQGSASTNFILPSAEQLFLNDCCEVGNPNLEPEESTNLNASVGVAADRHYWQITAFWREIDEIIEVDYSQPAYPDGIFMNLGEATIKGVEILGGVSLTERLTFDASYINNEVRLEGQGRQMDYNPRWHAKASLTYQQGRFGGSFAARWVSNVTSGQGTFGLVDHGDYAVADLSAFFYLDQNERHQITLRLENAFDETYPAMRGFRSASYDDGSGSFLAMLQGLPRTLRLGYRRHF
jgi:outer membrane cobalamin receptor